MEPLGLVMVTVPLWADITTSSVARAKSPSPSVISSAVAVMPVTVIENAALAAPLEGETRKTYVPAGSALPSSWAK